MDIKNNANVGGNPGSSNQKGNQTLMGVLSYLGILIIIPFFMAKGNPFVKFHIKQGLVLVVIELIVWVLRSMFWPYSYFMFSPMQIINLAVLVFVIIGIVNVVQGKEKELPLIGHFSRYFSF